MTIEATEDEDLGDSGYRGLSATEFVALGLFVVEAIVIIGFVAAGIANQVQFGGSGFSNEGLGSHVWGYTLTLAAQWSDPPAVVVFLLGPPALVAWSRSRGGGDLSADRTALVLRLALVLAGLTVVGGILSIAGRVMQFSPSTSWSTFFAVLGTGVGALCLGGVGIVVVKRLSDPAAEDEDR